MTNRQGINNDGWVEQSKRIVHVSWWGSNGDGLMMGTAVNARKLFTVLRISDSELSNKREVK